MIVHQSFQYAQNVVNGTIPSPKYVIKPCEKFLEICDGKSEKYFLDEQKLQRINDILKLLIMPRGLKAGSNKPLFSWKKTAQKSLRGGFRFRPLRTPT